MFLVSSKLSKYKTRNLYTSNLSIYTFFYYIFQLPVSHAPSHANIFNLIRDKVVLYIFTYSSHTTSYSLHANTRLLQFQPTSYQLERVLLTRKTHTLPGGRTSSNKGCSGTSCIDQFLLGVHTGASLFYGFITSF